MESLTLSQIWTVAGALGGFQVLALSWRINRELHMEEMGETTWLTLADGIVALSFLVLVGGVFLSPMFGATTADAINLLGLALTLFAPSVFILAGHYNLYCDWGVKYEKDGSKSPRDRCTRQELVATSIAVLFPVVYGILTWGPCLR